MGHVAPYPLIFTIRTQKYKHFLGYLSSSIWFYHIGTHFFTSPRVACHCDHVLIYPRATTEWRPYGSRYPVPCYFHKRDPQIETLPRIPPIFNMVLSPWDSLLSQPSNSLSLWPCSSLPTGSLYGCPSSTVPSHSWVNYLLHSYGFGCQPLRDPRGSSFRVACSSPPFQTFPDPRTGHIAPYLRCLLSRENLNSEFPA